jgi:hypothetical protein
LEPCLKSISLGIGFPKEMDMKAISVLLRSCLKKDIFVCLIAVDEDTNRIPPPWLVSPPAIFVSKDL